MRFSIAGSLAICLALAHAFKNTSPLFLISTSEHMPNDLAQLQTSDNALKATKEFLSTCSSKHYILVSQENVNVADFTSPRAVPFLRKAMKHERVQSVMNIAEVLDQSIADDIQEFLQKTCSASLEVFEGMNASASTTYFKTEADSAKITRVNYVDLPTDKPSRSNLLADFDASLGSMIDKLPSNSEYTIIYTTTPVLAMSHTSYYDPKFQTPLKTELKVRSDSSESYISARAVNDTRSTLPLFEKYQFLSPGIFMGIITVLILLTILSVGINAISSLQVSYGAFEKEMGPAANKK